MGFFMRSLLLKPCGRTHVRMHKPIGRSDDMLIIKGVNVFLSQIETVLRGKGIKPLSQDDIPVLFG